MNTNLSVKSPKSHRNEWKSKRNLEDLIEDLGMYMPLGWAIHYSINNLDKEINGWYASV